MKDEFKCYSQNGEDFILWNFFNYKTKGFFIDIGAFDGVHLSNTFSFEQQGWNGICVEANPSMFKICVVNRPSSKCFHYAVTEKYSGEVDFFVEEMGQLSTTLGDKEILDDIENRYKRRSINFSGINKIKVPSITFDRLLSNYFPNLKDIDFVSLDTEGNELNILKSINFNKYNIELLLVEANKKKEKDKILNLLSSYNYIVAKQVGNNFFFVKSDKSLKKIRSIKLKCKIERQEHPIGQNYTPKKYRTSHIIDETISQE